MQVIVAKTCFTLARMFRVLQLPFHFCDGALHGIELRLTLRGAAAWKRRIAGDRK